MDFTIKIGGSAGQGLQTIGEVLARIFSRGGFHVFTHQDYESRVRGGHNFYQIRVSGAPVSSSRISSDIIVALDRETISLHGGELSEGGRLLYDSETLKETFEDPAFMDIPFRKIAVEAGGSPVMSNTSAVGAVLGLTGMGFSALEDLIKETFAKKGPSVVEGNLRAAQKGHEFALKRCRRCGLIDEKPRNRGLMLINAIEAIALGAIASGVRFYSAYPMTPSTGIMNFLAGKALSLGMVVEQAEDEISAVNMALGASFSGLRAMTGTSGGGFALMVEGLSLAGMTETPIVIAEGQRPGPATGFPTRTEQGDLLFVIHSGHGEFPRAVFAPGSPEQAFFLTNKAFEIAEKYQIPAFVIYDQYLADSQWTYEGFDTEKIVFNDYRVRGREFSSLGQYQRHAYTESGVSPLGVPGDADFLVVTDSDEHDAEGHMVEDAETRIRMTEKRLFKKNKLLGGEISPPLFYGDPSARTVIVGWGSMFGLLKEAVDSSDGKAAMLHFSEIYPFAQTDSFDYLSVLRKAKRAICVEQNATGQFARLMRAETGFEFKESINKFDGRPFLLEELIGRINARD